MTDWEAAADERGEVIARLRQTQPLNVAADTGALIELVCWLQIFQPDAWSALVDYIAQPALPPGVAAGFPANGPVEPTPAGTGAVAGPAGEVRPYPSNPPSPSPAGGWGQPPSEPTCA